MKGSKVENIYRNNNYSHVVEVWNGSAWLYYDNSSSAPINQIMETAMRRVAAKEKIIKQFSQAALEELKRPLNDKEMEWIGDGHYWSAIYVDRTGVKYSRVWRCEVQNPRVYFPGPTYRFINFNPAGMANIDDHTLGLAFGLALLEKTVNALPQYDSDADLTQIDCSGHIDVTFENAGRPNYICFFLKRGKVEKKPKYEEW